MPDLELSVTICSWNTQNDLRACIASLEAAMGEAPFEVIVVDNNSEDGSPDMVASEFPWVRLYRMDRNLGFTGGHNYAMEQRKAPHVFLLNSDAAVHPGTIRSLLSFIRSNPGAGIIGPKVLNPDGSLQFSCRRFPNPLAALFRNTPIGKLFPNNRFTRDYLMQDWTHEAPREVDWVSGCAFLVRSEVIEKIGVFDTDYFMYFEDVDWCYRAWHGGFKVMYVPDAVVTHAIGRSTDKAPNRMIGRFHSSMLRFYRRNMLVKVPFVLRPLALACAAAAIGLRASLFITKNKLDAIKRKLHR
ncbi:MAG: glycosyltransferase family 2 protein [Fimbriimonas sp.]|nr:glycosyltransferase family 2 protein [Fimbriimonas sp.]